MGIFYKTVFVWSSNKKLYVFYRYKGIGLVPTGVDFVWRGKQYNTIQIMNVLSKKKQLKLEKPFISTDWFDLESGEFYRKNFVRFCRKLDFLETLY